MNSQSEHSSRSRLACLLLCLFIGVLGAHRFYVGKNGTAVLMLISFGGLGIWVIVDLIFILCGSFRDKGGLRVIGWMDHGGK